AAGLPLQLGKLLGHARRRDVAGLRRLRDGAVLGDGGQRPQALDAAHITETTEYRGRIVAFITWSLGPEWRSCSSVSTRSCSRSPVRRAPRSPAPSSRRPGPTPAPLPSFAARSRWCC